jgi:hypothetical protein
MPRASTQAYTRHCPSPNPGPVKDCFLQVCVSVAFIDLICAFAAISPPYAYRFCLSPHILYERQAQSTAKTTGVHTIPTENSSTRRSMCERQIWQPLLLHVHETGAQKTDGSPFSVRLAALVSIVPMCPILLAAEQHSSELFL